MTSKTIMACCALTAVSALAGSITDKGDYLLADGTAESPAEISANTTYSKPLYVGRDGAEGALKVEGATLTLNSSLFLSSSASPESRHETRSTLVLDSAVVSAGMAQFGANSPDDPEQIGVDVAALTLLGKSYLWANIICFDCFSGTIDFDGGTLRQNSGDALCTMSQNNSRLKLRAAAGKEIRIDTYSASYQLKSGMGRVTLEGEGGFRKTGPHTLSLPAERVLDYGGDTVVAEGALKLGISQQLPSGTGRGDLVLEGDAALDLNGKPTSVNAIRGAGSIVNSAEGTEAELAVGEDGSSWSFGKLAFGEGVALNKVGAGTLIASCALPKTVTVSGGTLKLAEHPRFSKYRFKVDKTFGSAAIVMQISEFQLLNGETDVTTCDAFVSVERSALGKDPGTAEGVAKAVDGSLDTKWIEWNGAYNSAYPDECYLVLTYSKPIEVSAYRWATANDCYDTAQNTCRSPKDFRLQGSNDGGATWVDLDVRRGYAGVSTVKTWVPESFACAALDATETEFAVLPGATLEIPFGTSVAGLENLGGTVLYGGDYVKESDGVETLDAKTSWTGDTIIRAGTLKLAEKTVATREVSDKYWRIAFKEICGKGNAGASIMQLSELSLYDAEGTRLTATMSDAGEKDVLSLAAGEVTYVKPNGARWTSGQGPASLFDGNQETKFCLQDFAGDATEPASWMTVVWRLPADAPAVAGYLFETANDTANKTYNGAWRNPKNWCLQSSADGVHWITVDAKRDVSSLVANYTWYNGGTPWGFTALDGAFSLGQTLGAKFFRFTVRKLVGADTYKAFQLSELGLFAADGSRVNEGLEFSTFGYDATLVTGTAVSLASGRICVESKGNGTLTSGVANLVDGSLDTKLCPTAFTPSPDDPDSQLVIAMRLADDKPTAVSYNMATGGDTASFPQRNPLSWKLESSYDGLHWTTVADVTDGSDVLTRENKAWFNGGVAMACTPDAAPVLRAGTTVEVAAGAVLDGSELSAKISGLRISMRDGAGTVSNFDPQANGTLDLVDVTDELFDCDLPISLTSVAGAAEAVKGWSVTVNGVPATNLKLRLTSAGKLRLHRTDLGFMLIFK